MTQPQTLREGFATELRVILARRKMTVRDAARQIGVTQSWMQRRMSGLTTPDLQDVELIASGLGVQVHDLLPVRTEAAAS